MTRDQAIALMIRLEGGYVNNPRDPGGATNGGITQRTLDSLEISGLPKDVKDLTQSQIAYIYQGIQWKAIAGDALPDSIAVLVLNAAINQGEPTAIRMLQSVVNVKLDGIMGPSSLAALDKWKSSYLPDQTLAEEFCAHVATHYAEFNAKEGEFELGWFRRLFRVYTLSLGQPT